MSVKVHTSRGAVLLVLIFLSRCSPTGARGRRELVSGGPRGSNSGNGKVGAGGPNPNDFDERGYSPSYRPSDNAMPQGYPADPRFGNDGGGYDRGGLPRQQEFERAGDNAAPSSLPNDAVLTYTRGLPAKLLVALAAALSSSLLFHLASNLILSRASLPVTLAIAALCAASSFTKGDLSNFSKALGVFTILMSRRTRPAKFLVSSVSQLKSLLMLSERRPFPPDANPWKYNGVPHGDSGGLPFSMMNAVIGVVVTGFLTGWSFSKLIPFFPGWLGSITCAVLFGYQCTLRDSRGDLLRLLGYAVNSFLSEISTTAEDVYLKEKTSLVIGKMFAFVHRLDQNYQIIAKLRAIMTKLVSQIASLVSRVKSDMESNDQANNPSNPPPNRYPPN